ncbi:MAG: tetratricopeptide repeat protein [Phycisphaerae bacterium]|nr:tetratricopeptide repeat protein [Phycisphaerae bacterium]
MRVATLLLGGLGCFISAGCERGGPSSGPAPAPAAATAVTSDGHRTAFDAVPRPPGKDPPFVLADDRIQIAKAMLRANRFDDAELALKTVLARRPDIAQAEFFLGVAIQKQKRYADAKPHFERVIALGSAFPEIDYVFHFLGWCLYYLGDLPGAQIAFEEHLRRVPTEADTQFGLGVVAFDDDRIDEAEAHFKRAIEMQLGDARAAREIAKAEARLSDVYVRRDRIVEAEQVLRDSVTRYPDHYEAWAKLARVLDRLERTDEATSAREQEQAAINRAAGRGDLSGTN